MLLCSVKNHPLWPSNDLIRLMTGMPMDNQFAVAILQDSRMDFVLQKSNPGPTKRFERLSSLTCLIVRNPITKYLVW